MKKDVIEQEQILDEICPKVEHDLYDNISNTLSHLNHEELKIREQSAFPLLKNLRTSKNIHFIFDHSQVKIILKAITHEIVLSQKIVLLSLLSSSTVFY